LNAKLRTFLLTKLNQRWDLICDDVHYASFLLDPRSCDLSLDEEYIDAAETCIKLVAGDFWVKGIEKQLYLFCASDGIYASNTHLAPRSYWTRLKSISVSAQLAKIALYFLGFPQSSASCERSFSPLCHIHTWNRRSLQRSTLSNLIYVYTNKDLLQ